MTAQAPAMTRRAVTRRRPRAGLDGGALAPGRGALAFPVLRVFGTAGGHGGLAGLRERAAGEVA